MNREIALSLFYAEQGYTSDGMKQYRVESPETRETWGREGTGRILERIPTCRSAAGKPWRTGERRNA